MKVDPLMLKAALIGYRHRCDQIDAKMAEIRRQLGDRAEDFGELANPAARKPRRKHGMSAEGKKRIADAARRRWAEFRARKAAK